MPCACLSCYKKNKCSNNFCIFCGVKIFKSQEKKQHHVLGIDECYSLLNTHPSNSDIELKHAYRKLAKVYHSDILKGKDLPLDIIMFGEEKFKRINFAYEKIKKHRNI